ncbi:Fic family protein [Pseudoflavitalea rhizosphaerae]|uniref:Fic family protein n=1 Tax=Pseudoflavitalea rhizosphaerae TaxID=1884793 RepID=UPI0019D0BD16|nr:Fic family protein [Pseudoflavitalea rhizosphaerae]
MQPPYNITSAILQLVATISEKIGEINATHLHKPPAELRKSNRIKTIQASLEIEGNTLSIEQITAIVENKRVLGPQKDILEVKNAIVVYEKLNEFNPNSIQSLLHAHNLLMKGLIDKSGKLRTKSVGIVKGSDITHIAPPGEMVKPLMNDLFGYLKSSKDLALIKSCVFHYELEFIHPFMDGNGRIGRLWQTVILKHQYPVFEYLPIETIVKQRQQQYYEALSKSDKSGNSTIFIEFMLGIILESLEELLSQQNRTLLSSDRVLVFSSIAGKKAFTRKEYLRHFKEISQATASRDLKEAVEEGVLKKTGEKNKTNYTFK